MIYGDILKMTVCNLVLIITTLGPILTKGLAYLLQLQLLITYSDLSIKSKTKAQYVAPVTERRKDVRAHLLHVTMLSIKVPVPVAILLLS